MSQLGDSSNGLPPGSHGDSPTAPAPNGLRELTSDSVASSALGASSEPAEAILVAECPAGRGSSDWLHSLALPHVGWALFWVFVIMFAQLGFGMIWEVGQVAATGGRSLWGPEEASQVAPQLAAAAVVYSTLTTLCTAVAVGGGLFRRDFLRRMALRGLAPGHLILSILVVLPMAILASEVTNWASEVLPQLTTEIFEDFGKQSWWLVFLGACLFPGIGEEILFRGFLGRGLLARHGVLAGVTLTSLLFGLIHIDPVQGCGAMFLGFGLHGVFLATRSLTASILVHTLNNALAFAVMKYADQLPEAGLTAGADGAVTHIPSYLLLAAALAAGGCCWMFWQTRARWQLPDGSEWTPGYQSAEMPPAEFSATLYLGRPSVFAIATLVVTYSALVAALYATAILPGM